MAKLTSTELDKIRAHQQAQLDEYLAQARSPAERAELLAHATEPGVCDPEYCPWQAYPESLCIRAQQHGPNCRCHDCCADDDMD